MADDLIRYDILAQEALRGVVRKVLTEVAQTGLPGDHHFFITIDTNHPGVRMSSRLKEQYPKEMTVVLQHQFWDLGVTDTAFEVGLSFNGIPERLLIPYRAITSFVDPFASFGLKFEDADAVQAANQPEIADNSDLATDPAASNDAPPKPLPALPASEGPAEQPEAASEESDSTVEADEEHPDEPDAAPEEEPPSGDGADIVSLDAFRKKNG